MLTFSLFYVKLLQNPNPNDTTTSYAVNKAKHAKANELGDPKTGWRFNKKDKKTIKKNKATSSLCITPSFSLLNFGLF